MENCICLLKRQNDMDVQVRQGRMGQGVRGPWRLVLRRVLRIRKTSEARAYRAGCTGSMDVEF